MDQPHYTDLDAWQAGMSLVESCYLATTPFPRHEMFGLTSQMRRAAISIPLNIAEGACRRSRRAFANHVAIALGSHAELETCIELARRLGYLTEPERSKLSAHCARAGRLLNGLLRSFDHRA
jgi:four helix bundle protein